MANKSYNRIYLRKHFASNIYVSNDGRHAERDIHSKSAGQDTVLVYNIYKEECGRAFIHDKYKGTFYLDELVLTCFRGLPPQDGKNISHITEMAISRTPLSQIWSGERKLRKPPIPMRG